MKFKLDENLGQAVAGMLRAAGHDASTVAEQHMTSAPDTDIYSVCRKEGRALVTLDTDFANPMTYPPDGGPGIAVLRVGDTASIVRIRACLAQLAEMLKSNPIAGHLWIVEVHRVREYQSDD